MNAARQGLIIIGSLLFFAVGCKSHLERSDRVELFRHPGVQWLTWTPAERETFVYGYIEGYGHGTNQACLAADNLFEKDKPHVFGHDDVPSTFPSARCRASVTNYANVQIDLSKGPDFTAYTMVITEFYTKYPAYRDTPITLLMESLVGTKGLTADDIYGKWTTGESAPSSKP